MQTAVATTQETFESPAEFCLVMEMCFPQRISVSPSLAHVFPLCVWREAGIYLTISAFKCRL